MERGLSSIPGHAAMGGHRRPRMCSSWAGGIGPSSLATSARNSLPKKYLLNTHQNAVSLARSLGMKQ